MNLEGTVEYVLWTWGLGSYEVSFMWPMWLLRMDSQTSASLPLLVTACHLYPPVSVLAGQHAELGLSECNRGYQGKKKKSSRAYWETKLGKKGESYLPVLWQEALHFCFTLGFTNYVAGPVWYTVIPLVSPLWLSAFLWLCVFRRKITPRFSCLPLPCVSKCFYWDF